MSPRSVSVAMPTCTDRATWMPSSCHDAFISGWSAHVSAKRGDEHRERRHVELSPERLELGAVHRSERRHLRDRRHLGQPPGDLPAHGRDGLHVRASSGSTHRAAFTSSTVIRPPGPVPVIVARSMPRSFASLRTAGVRRRRLRRSMRRASIADGASAWPVASPSGDRERHQRRADGDRVAHRPCSVAMRPANGDGISTVAFAVSTSTSGWFSVDLVPRGDQPRDDLALLQSLAEVRHGEHALGHQYFTVRRTASAIRSTLGR